MDKPGSWLLLAKCLKKAGHRPLPQVFFKHFARKNQLPGFYITGTLVENGLKKEVSSAKKFRVSSKILISIVDRVPQKEIHKSNLVESQH